MMVSHSPSAHPGTTHRDVLEALWKRSIEKFLPFYNKHGARAMSHPGNEYPERRGRERRGSVRHQGEAFSGTDPKARPSERLYV